MTTRGETNRFLAITIAIPWFIIGHSRAEIARPLMKDFIGINGHTVQFKPDLYQPVASLVRDYHPVEWDLGTDTSTLPDFPFAKNRVDWNGVYGSWSKQSWTIDACLMFESIKREDWKNIEADANAYGKAFATSFGPSGGAKLVESIEIGNEPGKWSDADYSVMLKSMATGIRAGDPQMKIATCNLTTGKSGDYEKSVECLSGLAPLYDILTIHSYAQLEGWPTWRRSFPEDPALARYLPDVLDLCKWRDKNAAGKPVWITEFGYDSTTRPNDTTGTFEKWVGVTDVQQAQWLVRSLLIFSSMPVERAYIYFFNDEDKPSLHASAGLTRNFIPKPSFHAVAHLTSILGHFRFEKTIKDESGHVRLHEYISSNGKTIWAIWSPTGSGKETTVTLDHLPGKPVSIQRMPIAAAFQQETVPDVTGDSVILKISESPVYVTFIR